MAPSTLLHAGQRFRSRCDGIHGNAGNVASVRSGPSWRSPVRERGIAPRHFARIQRFHALLRASDLAPRPSWAALAAPHGYAEQSP